MPSHDPRFPSAPQVGAEAERAGAMMHGGQAQQRMVSGHWTARQSYHHSQRTWFAGNQFLDGVSRMVQPTPLIEISRNILQSSDGLSSLFKPARPSKHSHKEGEYPVVGPVLETPPNPPAPPPLLIHDSFTSADAYSSSGFLTARRLNGTEVVMGPSGPEVAYVAPEALSTHRTQQAGALTYRSHASAITHRSQASALTHRSHRSQVVDELESPGLKL